MSNKTINFCFTCGASVIVIATHSCFHNAKGKDVVFDVFSRNGWWKLGQYVEREDFYFGKF